MMPANANPHVPSSSASSIQYLFNATLFIEIGSGVEWEEAMLTQSVRSDLRKSDTAIVSCMDMLGLGHDHDHDDCEHNHNSHIWANPVHLRTIAEELKDVLLEHFPWLGEDAEHGLDYYLNEMGHGGLNHMIQLVDRIITGRGVWLPAEPGQTIFVWHNAWDPLMDLFNERANILLEPEDPFDDDDPFIKVVSGEKGIGDTPTVSDIGSYFGTPGQNNKIFVSPFDAASQYSAMFEQAGYEVVLINPTAEDWLNQLDTFLHDLRSSLCERST